jgi:hypothetical protein
LTALVVNLFGGPGTGKSTTAAAVFAALKYREINVEMAREYAKDLVWSKADWSLHNQLHVFGEQHHRLWTLLEQVDVIVTDSPLLLSLLYYRGPSTAFRTLVWEEAKKLNSLNFMLTRVKSFNPSGRLQNESEARALDTKCREMLCECEVPFVEVVADDQAAAKIVDAIMEQITHRWGPHSKDWYRCPCHGCFQHRRANGTENA